MTTQLPLDFVMKRLIETCKQADRAMERAGTPSHAALRRRLRHSAELGEAALNNAARAEAAEEDIEFLLRLVPAWALEDVPDGLDPIFYGTLSAAGDREVAARVAAIREAYRRASEGQVTG